MGKEKENIYFDNNNNNNNNGDNDGRSDTLGRINNDTSIIDVDNGRDSWSSDGAAGIPTTKTTGDG